MFQGTGVSGKSKLAALGYREEIRGGLSWLVMEAGFRLVGTEEDWSPESLALKKWSFWDKGSHALYLTNQDGDGKRVLVKVYYAMNRSGFFARPVNKARNEFTNTLVAYTEGFNTLLPLAFGEKKGDRGWGVIAYPFLENAVTLEDAYPYRDHEGLPLSERRHLEKSVGRLLRRSLDTGVFPVNMCLGHFLAERENGGGLGVYWVDFERVKFRSLFSEKYAVRNLAKLLARMEWLRASGAKINRSSVMRIGHACLRRKDSGKLDKDMCRAIIQAAKKYWEYREIDSKGSYPLNSIQPVDHGTP